MRYFRISDIISGKVLINGVKATTISLNNGPR